MPKKNLIESDQTNLTLTMLDISINYTHPNLYPINFQDFIFVMQLYSMENKQHESWSAVFWGFFLQNCTQDSVRVSMEKDYGSHVLIWGVLEKMELKKMLPCEACNGV